MVGAADASANPPAKVHEKYLNLTS